RRARRPRARQRPLPHELLGHEGLRRLRLPARGRAGADHDRGVGGGRRAHCLDGGCAADPWLRPRGPAAPARADARRRGRGRARGRPGMREAQVAALWQGFVHGEGTGYHGQVELALPFSLVWAGRGIKTFTATGDLPVVEGEPVLFEIWVCADGYWADHTKNLVVGELKPEYAELEERLMRAYGAALDFIRPGVPMPELDVLVRERLAYEPTHPICHG